MTGRDSDEADVERRSDDFVELMSAHQGRIFGHLVVLAGDVDAANDVLQETNVVLWKQWEQFRPGSNFKAWAFRIAHFQYMAYRQKRLRERVLFSDDLLATLAEESSRRDDDHAERASRLEMCIERLAPHARRAIHMRYWEGLSAREMSERLGRTANATYQLLHRTRQSLLACLADASPRGEAS